MKTTISFIFGLLLTGISQGQQLDWAYSIKDNSVQNSANAIASNGRFCVINASVKQNISYDFKEGNTTYNGTSHVVAMYNDNGEIQWVKEHPGGGNLYRTRILSIDNSDQVFACGRFSGSIDFDPGTGTQMVTAGSGSVYIQKLNKDGELVWVGHTSIDGEPVKMGFKRNGNIVVIGRTQDSSTAILKGGATSKIDKGVFVVEFAGNGDVLYAYSIPTPTSFNNNLGLAIDASDCVYIGASIDGIFNLDLKSRNLPDTSHSGYDAVLVKYTSDYNYVWHKVFGDKPTSAPDGWDVINHLSIGPDGKLYAAGWFTWTSDFDPDQNPGVWVKTAATGSQSPDGFLIQYDTSGSIQWIQEAGGHPSISGNADVNFLDMVISGDQIVLIGSLNGGADFDGSANDSILRTIDNGLGICLVRYTKTGAFGGAWLLDGNLANEYATGIEILDDGIVAYGTFQKKLDADLSKGVYFLQTDSTGPYYFADNDLFLIRYDFAFEQSSGTKTHIKPLNVYPNPSTGMLYFNYAQKPEKVELCDLNGRVVCIHLNPESNSLNVNHITQGVYYLNVYSNCEVHKGKVVIQR